MTNEPTNAAPKRTGRPKGAKDKTPRKRKSSGIMGYPNDLEKRCSADRPEISRLLMNSLYWLDKPKPRTDEEVEQRVYEFFARVAETGEIPTVEKLALALGTNSSTMYDWQIGKGPNGTPRRAAVIKSAKQFLASFDAELVSNGKLPVASYIFRAKNFFGMRDEPIQEAQSNERAATSADELMRLYGESNADGGEDSIEGNILD